tara:strand:+ start:412 stop:759 length:348 start_codon:yes stop_codon:yes gene_type:complete
MKRLTVHVANQPKVDTQQPTSTKSNKKTSTSAYEKAQEQGQIDREKVSNNTIQTKVKKGRFKVYTTITVRDLKDRKDVNNALADIRKKYTIAICPDSRRSNWKSGDEMIHIAWQN